jgi:hypothetical protein
LTLVYNDQKADHEPDKYEFCQPIDATPMHPEYLSLTASSAHPLLR